MVTKSRAAVARISAQETMPGHSSSSAVLTRVTRSKPSPERERLMSASRSALLKALVATRMEASQPSTRQSWKRRRRVAAAVVGAANCLSCTICRMISGNFGHVFW
ncbi:peroxidase [Trema orientale]|uniref:Peroxidase n=1 Tax=Trema orientale TaxID=63057 RepID=A0A2P5FDK8_TREOI|nr:peroxidase [Trema orientale]